MVAQLVAHVYVHDDFLPAKHGEQEDGHLYYKADAVGHRMEVNYIESPYNKKSHEARLHGIPQLPQVVALYLCAEPITGVFLPRWHLLHQLDGGADAAKRLSCTAYD